MTKSNGETHPVENWFTQDLWDSLFPMANNHAFENTKPYSFNAMVTAIRHFPDFANGSEQEQKKEMAALLGICLQEVGGKSLQDGGNLNFPGLTKTKSGGFTEPTWDDIRSYNWNLAFSSEQGAERSTSYDTGYPDLKPNQKYFSGAGILQLSYPANYARFSEYYFKDKDVLLNNSDRVRKEGELAIGSGIFYWMNQADSRPSVHCCFTGKAVNSKDKECFGRITSKGYKKGLAMAICAVNGIECSIPADYRVGTRVYGYLQYGQTFGLKEDELLNDCFLETNDMPTNLNTV